MCTEKFSLEIGEFFLFPRAKKAEKGLHFLTVCTYILLEFVKQACFSCLI